MNLEIQKNDPMSNTANIESLKQCKLYMIRKKKIHSARQPKKKKTL